MTLYWDIQYLCGVCPTQNEQQREPSALSLSLSLSLSLTARQVAASYCCPSFQFQKHLPPKRIFKESGREKEMGGTTWTLPREKRRDHQGLKQGSSMWENNSVCKSGCLQTLCLYAVGTGFRQDACVSHICLSLLKLSWGKGLIYLNLRFPHLSDSNNTCPANFTGFVARIK